MNEMAGARAHELQQEASLAIVLRIYRCDGRRTRSPEKPEKPDLRERRRRSEFVRTAVRCTPGLECIS
jgi:hypothetical protein